jgi:hypothetical protein
MRVFLVRFFLMMRVFLEGSLKPRLIPGLRRGKL